jgi:hypothetical protein
MLFQAFEILLDVEFRLAAGGGEGGEPGPGGTLEGLGRRPKTARLKTQDLNFEIGGAAESCAGRPGGRAFGCGELPFLGFGRGKDLV